VHCVCGRYRFADQVKEAVDRAPPLSPAQRDRIAALFDTVDIDMTRIARVGELAKVIERHPLLRYPQECACGEHLETRQAWARHVAEDVLSLREAAGEHKPRR
jgi:hypothetical protein